MDLGLDHQYKFPLGRTVITPAALEVIPTVEVLLALEMHRCGIWGTLSKEDMKSNDDAVEHGGRILSAYLADNVKFWVITECDRSATTVLLPSDY